MNNDLISRSALLEDIRSLAKDIARRNGGVDDITIALKEAFDIAKQAPAADAEPKWISVQDRLPEDDAHYLCYTTDAICELCIYCGDGEWMTPDLENMTLFVTHWMPPPEPPEELKEEWP